MYEPYLPAAKKAVGGDPFLCTDYRKLLDRKDVDGVVIATPDHWHALQFIDACEAGKDPYVEKPLSLTVVEGRKMVEAAKRTKRVTAMGAQRRSSAYCRQMAETVRSGVIGEGLEIDGPFGHISHNMALQLIRAKERLSQVRVAVITTKINRESISWLKSLLLQELKPDPMRSKR